MKIEELPIKEIQEYENNAKLHPPEQIDQIIKSIEQFGFNDPIAVDQNNVIIEGHGRLIALQKMGQTKAPIIRLSHLSEDQKKAYILAHNQLTLNTGFDEELLRLELESIVSVDMGDFGFDLDLSDFGDDEDPQGTSTDEPERKPLVDSFIVPPFSVFDCRQGYWTERKREWKQRIQDKAQARAHATVYMDDKPDYMAKFETEVSILDPVLAEIIVQYFTPKNSGNCFDCFAGDTVFGFVAAYLGKKFTGIELRQEQADFNNERVKAFGLNANYICDDGRNVANHIKLSSQDLLFSCPPYFDLEKYSDLPNDASNQKTWEDFYSILDEAYTQAIKCLKNNRFAVVVCTDLRDPNTGYYYDFQGDLIKTFAKNGMYLYNSIILATSIGTAAVRARKSMPSRKLCRVHQNVLVFYKGDTKNIKKHFGEVEVTDGGFNDDDNS